MGPSATDNANFINFCSGQTITNGLQITAGSCNGIPMGKIPASKNMITAMITNPQIGDKVPADTTFNISVQTQHLNAGNAGKGGKNAGNANVGKMETGKVDGKAQDQ